MKFGKIAGLFLSLIIIFNTVAFSRDISTYDYLSRQNSDILTRLRDEGLPNVRINEFLNELDDEADKLQTSEDLYTLEEYFLVILFNIVLEKEDFADVCGAFDIAFQEELTYMLENDMKLPELFNELFLSVMYDKIKPENPDENTDFSEPTPDETQEPENPPQDDYITPKEPVFSDVAGDFWAYSHILSLYEKNIVSVETAKSEEGEKKLFYPNGGVTRAELAEIVCNAFLSENYKSNIKYSDISPDLPYRKYVEICEYYSIFSGITGENFKGWERVSRQEMCAVSYRAFVCSRKKTQDFTKKDFPDMNLLSPYAVEAVEFLQATGIVQGYGDHNFYPSAPTTKAELCKVINMLMSI